MFIFHFYFYLMAVMTPGIHEVAAVSCRDFHLVVMSIVDFWLFDLLLRHFVIYVSTKYYLFELEQLGSLDFWIMCL